MASASTAPMVTLTLSQIEAETLLALLCRVGGDMKTTRRLYTKAIADALVVVGVVEPLVGITTTSTSLNFLP